MKGMQVYGCYDQAKAGERRSAIKSACTTEHLPSPTFEHPDFITATAEAIIQVRKGMKVVIVGYLEDLLAPKHASGYVDLEWRESWIAFLEGEGIAFTPVGKTRRTALEHTTKSTVIRSYQRATSQLQRMIQEQLKVLRREGTRDEPGYVCGRPPYGYRVENGRFQIDTNQSAAVRCIFKHFKDGGTTAALLRVLADKHADGGLKTGKAQFWDRVKIRRILRHASLYCRGLYASTTGNEVKLADLAFLPADWENLKQVQAMTSAVPSGEGGGTLRASTATLRRGP